MKKLPALLFLLIALVKLSSCELIVDVDVPYDGDKLVINGVQQLDQPWKVDLSYSKYILSNLYQGGFLSVPNASVTVYGDEGEVFELQPDSLGYYVHNSYPREGHKYTIVAHSNESNEVKADMSVPTAVKIRSVKWDSTAVSHSNSSGVEYWGARLPLTVTFDDPPGEKNYYSVGVIVKFTVTRNYPGEPGPRTDTITQFFQAAIVDPGIATEEEHKTRFSDVLFDGTTYSAPMEVMAGGAPDFSTYQVEVRLISLSEDQFRYEESISLYRQTNGDPFAQPVQIYSNVQNGFGIFAASSVDFIRWNKAPK